MSRDLPAFAISSAKWPSNQSRAVRPSRPCEGPRFSFHTFLYLNLPQEFQILPTLQQVHAVARCCCYQISRKRWTSRNQHDHQHCYGHDILRLHQLSESSTPDTIIRDVCRRHLELPAIAAAFNNKFPFRAVSKLICLQLDSRIVCSSCETLEHKSY